MASGLILFLQIAAQAAPTDQIRISAVLEFGQLYPPDRWLPVRYLISNESDASFTGTIQLGDPCVVTGSGSAISARATVIVPAHSQVSGSGLAILPPSKSGPAKDSATPLARVILRDPRGGEVARTDLLGQGADPKTGQLLGPLLLSWNDREDSAAQAATVYDLPRDVLSGISDHLWMGTPVQPWEFPRTLPAYDGVPLVIIDGADVESLDQSQRDALRQFVLRGGTLVMSQPTPAMRLGTSWLADMMPVEIVGWREASRLNVTSDVIRLAGPIELLAPAAICEGVLKPGATAIARDGSYVHVASRPVGLGRVVFTSFPVASLSSTSQVTLQLWREALQVGRASSDWRETKLGEPAQQDQLLRRLVGREAPAWSMAATVAIAYVAVVLLVQLLMRGASRPLAYLANVAAAVLLAGGLVLTATMRQKDSKLSGGRVVTVDLGAQGGGRQQSVVAFIGKNDANFALEASDGSVTMTPVLSSKAEPARVDWPPMRAPTAGVSAESIKQFWMLDAPLGPQVRLGARARFGAGGLSLSFENELGGKFTAPVLLYGPRTIALSDLPAGASQQSLGNAGESAVKTQESRLRLDLLDAALASAQTRSTDPTALPLLVIAGSLADAPWGFVATPKPEQALSQQVLARTPVVIEPTPPGERVVIDGRFSRVVYENLAGLPVVQGKEAWNSIGQVGGWDIGFAYPHEIGRVEASKVTLELHAVSQSHTITFRHRKGGGVIRQLPAGVYPAGTTIEFVPEPGDVDSNGWVWVNLDVQPKDPMAMGGTAQWQVLYLRMKYEGTVTAAPQLPLLPVRDATSGGGGGEKPAPPKAPPAKGGATKPPATKPAARQK